MNNQQENVLKLEEEIKLLKKQLDDKNTSSRANSLIDEETLQLMNDFNDIVNDNMNYVKVDKNLNVQSVSKSFGILTGFSNLNFVGKSFNILVAAEYAEKFYNGCEYVKNHGSESWGTEVMISTIENKEVYVKLIINPLFKKGQLEGFIFVVHDVSSLRLLHKLQVKMLAQEKFHESTFDFIASTSAAVLDTVSYKVSTVVKIVVSFIVLFLIYAVSFDIDEISRGQGQFIPTSKVQYIKNLEGGVVSSIYAKEGDSIKKGQVLMKLSPISYQTKLDENNIRLSELIAKKSRLKAESQGLPMEEIECNGECDKDLIELEKSYYLSNKKELKRNISKQMEQLKFQESALVDAKNKFEVLNENYKMLKEEFKTKKKLEEQKIFTRYELRELERELNDALSGVRSAKENIVQTKTQIQEIKDGIEETKLTFRNKASSLYSETVAEILRLKETQKNLEDILERTIIRSPVDGVIKELFVHTIGSSVQASADIMTIVPDNYEMIAEVKVKPEEIAKLHIGQDVKLKVTAFDYSIYGDLEGKITNISPDTIIDKDTGDSHYLIYVKTKKNYLNNNEKYKIKVGMMVNADILVGKKSIMSFLLKPILKTTQRD
jgi:adhesin transport system membrane fusion protein